MEQYTLNLSPGKVLEVVNASQYDTGRQWRFNLIYADDVYTIPSGATIRIDGTKPDQKGFSYNQSDDVTEAGADYVIVTCTSQMTAVAGDVMCELRIQQGAKDIGTANFILRVEKAAVAADTDMSETEIPAIVDAATQQMMAAARSAEAAYESELNAKTSELNAKASEEAAASSAENADDSADIAKSWATYPTDPAARGSATNNSQYWSDQAEITYRHTQSSMSTAEAAAAAALLSEQHAQSSKTTAEAAAAAALLSEQHAQSSKTMAEAAKTAAEVARDTSKNWSDVSESWAKHAQSSKTTAEAAMNDAKGWSFVSEGWAMHAQSSKTTAEAAKDAAKASENAAKASEDAASDEADRAKSWADYSANPDTWGTDTTNAHYWADHSQSSRTMADAAKDLARLWAVGPSGSGTPSATNNAEYWAHEAQSAAGGGVTSWNTRTGGVLPQAGDYSADQISYDGGFVDQKKADVNSPTLTGEPRSTTPPDGDNSTRIATTEFVYRAGGGSVITVTTSEATLRGQDVTLTDGVETMTETFNAEGRAIFRGVRMTGALTVSSTDGTDTAVKGITILYYGTYAVNLIFEYATIRINTSDPLLIGRTAYVHDSNDVQVGSVQLTGGTGDVIVHDTGTFTVRASSQGISTESAVTVSDYFETYNVNLALAYATLNVTTSETTLYNQAISVKSNGAVVATGTFSSSGAATIYTGTFGALSIESTDGSETAASTVTVAAGQSYTIALAFEYATIEVNTTDPLLAGATVTAELNGETYSGSFVNGTASIVVKETGTYTISSGADGITGSTTATVQAFFTTVTATLNLNYATLNITAGEASLYSGSATISYNSRTKTVTLDSTGHGTAYIGYAGSVTVTATDGTDTATSTLTVAYGQSYNVTLLFSYATIRVTTTDPLLAGATVTATLSGVSYTGVITSGSCDITVKELGTYTLTASAGGFSLSESVNVAAYFNTYTKAVSLPYATINVTTSETSLYGKTISVKRGTTEIATGTFSGSGSASIKVGSTGSLTVSSTDGTDTASATVTISAYQTTVTAELSFFKIVTWANGTDEEVTAMLEADAAGKINIYDYWTIGDTRNVSISAMSATGVGESHVAQTVQLVLVAKNVVDVSGGGKCKFVWQLKDGLANGTTGETGYMNSTNTNVGGWKDSARRTWCNSVFYNALPSWLKGITKEASIKTSKGNQLTTFDTTADKCFLPCEYNIFGTTTYSVTGEDTVHWEWYQTAANRIKKNGSGGSANNWWLRSPRASDATSFCRVHNSGSASYGTAGYSFLLAPCGCI